MVYPAMNTTITHSNGTEIPNMIYDIRTQPSRLHQSYNKELPGQASQTSMSDQYIVTQRHYQSFLKPKTTESTDEEMPEDYGSTSASSTDLRDEWNIHDEYLIRVHNRPITALLTPSDIQDSPKLP